MSRLFRTEGIILKSIKLNEADKIVTIFTKDYGKIKGIVKGVRKTRSQFGSSMENLTIIKLLAYKGKNLITISQSEIINSFFSQSKDLFRYGLAIHCSKIIDKLSAEEDPNPKLYELFQNLLFLLNDEQNPTLLVESFKWKLLTILGFQPELKKCVYCHNLAKKDEYYIFDIPRGGVSCFNCLNGTGRYQIKITYYLLRLLQRILVVDLIDIHNKSLSPIILSELSKITDLFLNFHFEIENRSKYFLESCYLKK